MRPSLQLLLQPIVATVSLHCYYISQFSDNRAVYPLQYAQSRCSGLANLDHRDRTGLFTTDDALSFDYNNDLCRPRPIC